ncbi:MAG: glycosyltransferase [Bacteroidales bacterium]|nr:glycosyltransferase [Bacteroidales bacterium]
MITNEVILWSVLIVFITSWFVQQIYYSLIFGRFIKKPKPHNDISEPVPVSVVICARNEATNLEKYLPMVLEQDYPNFEVIVVNDCSDDETEDVLKRFQGRYPHLRTTFLKEQEKFWHGKKLALTVGIKAARHEWLLLTDADCAPSSNEWIKTMAKHFTEDKSIVLGYGGYLEYPGFLNRLIRYETAFIALQFFSYALARMPYMGVGRNLAYRKSLFFAHKGFASHAKLDSGDDDLFINEAATPDNVAIEWSDKAHTYTEPKKKFSLWVEQKKRHLTTFTKYKKIHKLILGGEVFTRVIFYISFIFLLSNKFYIELVILLFSLRFINQLVVMRILLKRLKEKRLFVWTPFFDITLPFINLYIYLLNKIRPYRRWR